MVFLLSPPIPSGVRLCEGRLRAHGAALRAEGSVRLRGGGGGYGENRAGRPRLKGKGELRACCIPLPSRPPLPAARLRGSAGDGPTGCGAERSGTVRQVNKGEREGEGGSPAWFAPSSSREGRWMCGCRSAPG